MSITVREVLALPVVSRAAPRVLAGSSNLDRAVRWVHVAELPDIAYLLKGGELLLTTGMGLADAATPYTRYVDELAAAGAAGLVIELGRTFRQIPADMIRAAERRGLPLIELRRETRYVEVTEDVHRAIISRQYELLSTVERISRAFTDLLLDGSSISRIVQHLSNVVGNPVILENTAHQAIEFAARNAEEAAGILSGWERHSRIGHREEEPGRVHREAGSPPCAWAGIWLRHERWGRVHVIEWDERPGELIELILDRAGAALGLALLSQQDVAHLADRAGSALIADVLAGRFGSSGEILRRAQSLGTDLSAGHLVAVVVEPANLADLAERSGMTEHERQRVRLRLTAKLREVTAEHGCVCLAGIAGDRLLAVVAVPLRLVPREVLNAAATELIREIAATDPNLSVLLGVSRATRLDSLPRAFEEAHEAVALGQRSGRGAGLYHFGDLGLHHLLVRLAQGPELAAFVESELGPLLEHDARTRAAVLLPTLRVYLDNACRKSDAARAMWIQRRTLYGRLSRIERLIGRSLDDQDSRTRLAVAIAGLDMLRHRVRVSGTND